MRFVRTAIQTESAIFTNCLLWVRQNFWQSQIICCSKNSTASQSKQHDIHSVSVYKMKHVISHIHLISVYWMKHVISQLPGHSCLHSFILFFLFNFNCASMSLYILRLDHALLILYFLSLYSHQGRWHFFKRGICYGYSAATASS